MTAILLREIFEKKAAPGFYDTSEEQARAASAPVGQSLRRLENKRKPDEEEAERKEKTEAAAKKVKAGRSKPSSLPHAMRRFRSSGS